MVTEEIPPMRGVRGLLLERTGAGAGSSAGEFLGIGNSKAESKSVARVLSCAIAFERHLSRGLGIPNSSGLPQPVSEVPRISTTGLSGRVIGDVEPQRVDPT